VRALGIEIRAGLHIGEAEVVEKGVRGIAVHTGARVMGKAEGGQVLVTRNLKELVDGSGFGFEDRGTFELKGVEGERRLFQLTEVDGSPIAPPLPPEEAKARRDAIQAPTLVDRVRRRPVKLAVVAVAVVALIGIVASLARRDDSATAAPGPPPGSLVKVDLTTGERTTVITELPATLLRGYRYGPTGEFPVRLSHGLIVGEGAIWSHEGSFILKIDPETGKEIDSEQPAPQMSAFGIVGGAVWVCTPRSIERMDSDLRTLPPIKWPFDGCLGIEQQKGRVWALALSGTNVGFNAPGELVTFDVSSREVAGVGSPTEESACCFALGDDAEWVAEVGGVLRYDLQGSPPGMISGTPASINDIVVAGSRVWVLDPDSGIVTVIDPRTMSVEGPLQGVGAASADLAVAMGSLWVADVKDGFVRRIDPVSRVVLDEYDVGPGVASIAIDEETDTLWARIYDIEEFTPRSA
jgi:hypothetical protein